MTKFRKILMYAIYYLLQFTWGIIQNLPGLVLFLILIKKPHSFFHGAVVTYWGGRTSMGMGMFIFQGDINGKPRPYTDSFYQEFDQKILSHEFGHTIQSIILGPLFLLIIALPSAVWCNVPIFDKYRKKKDISYYRAYPERWANHLGKLITKIEGPQK